MNSNRLPPDGRVNRHSLAMTAGRNTKAQQASGTAIGDFSNISTRTKPNPQRHGELTWDYAWACTTAPKAQGAVGFLKTGGTIELKDIVIRSENEYAAICVVAMTSPPAVPTILVPVGTTAA
jgi:hypothetical protein